MSEKLFYHFFSRLGKNEKAKKSLDSFMSLDKDWDSYGSPPIEWNIIDTSKRVVDLVSSMGGTISWVLPTSDGTTLMMFSVSEKTFKVEVDDASMGVQLINWRNNGLERQFYDATIDNLKEVLTNAK